MPLYTSPQGSIPTNHDRCGFDPCIGCKAILHLTEDDKAAMAFFDVVRDQVIEGHPGPEGQRILYPRLEGWVAASEIYGIPQESRAALVDTARLIFDGVYERIKVDGLHRMPESAFEAPGDELLDG